MIVQHLRRGEGDHALLANVGIPQVIEAVGCELGIGVVGFVARLALVRLALVVGTLAMHEKALLSPEILLA